jgi:acyl carrier protein
MSPQRSIGIDPYDLHDFFIGVEKSFGVKLQPQDLPIGLTIKQFCECVARKIPLTQEENCTTQQAFYKLRETIATIVDADAKTITPDTSLHQLFPIQNRRRQIKQLNEKLDMQLNLLQPRSWLVFALVVVLIISLVGVFFKFRFAYPLILSYIGLWASKKTARHFDLNTVGEVAEKMTRQHYLQSRRKASVNNKEIEKVIASLLIHDLGLEAEEIHPENILID